MRWGRGAWLNTWGTRVLRGGVRTAVRIYGPLRLGAVPLHLALDAVDRLGPRIPGGEVVDPVLERLVKARALAAIGLITLAVEASFAMQWRWHWVTDWLYETLVKGLAAMVVAPFGVFILLAVSIALARPGNRRRVMLEARRPAVTAAFTLLVFGALAWAVNVLQRNQAVVTERLDGFLADTQQHTPVFVLLSVVGCGVFFWVFTFLCCTIYLAQRNGLIRDRGTFPLLPPTLSVLLVWMNLAAGVSPAAAPGWRGVLSDYGPPVAVTVLAVVEVITLRKRYGIGFRGPIPRTDRTPAGTG